MRKARRRLALDALGPPFELKAGGAFENRPGEYALTRLNYYRCEGCGEPYFGGTARRTRTRGRAAASRGAPANSRRRRRRTVCCARTVPRRRPRRRARGGKARPGTGTARARRRRWSISVATAARWRCGAATWSGSSGEDALLRPVPRPVGQGRGGVQELDVRPAEEDVQQAELPAQGGPPGTREGVQPRVRAVQTLGKISTPRGTTNEDKGLSA